LYQIRDLISNSSTQQELSCHFSISHYLTIQGGAGAQLTRFLPLREASSVLEDEEPRWSEFPGARKGSPGWEAVHGGGSGGGSRGAEGAGSEGRASAKEEGHKGRGWGFL